MLLVDELNGLASFGKDPGAEEEAGAFACVARGASCAGAHLAAG